MGFPLLLLLLFICLLLTKNYLINVQFTAVIFLGSIFNRRLNVGIVCPRSRYPSFSTEHDRKPVKLHAGSSGNRCYVGLVPSLRKNCGAVIESSRDSRLRQRDKKVGGLQRWRCRLGFQPLRF